MEQEAMDIWTMIVLIVAISVISDLIKSRNNNNESESIKSDENISQHIGPLEERVANLETIILEKERVDRFAELEKNDGGC
jgi:cell division protein ZapA (FtsZ GTPase activity inhibitor)